MERSRPFRHFKFPDEITILYKKMDKKDCSWHNVPENAWHVWCENYDWFPRDLIAGTDRQVHVKRHPLSVQSGWVDSTGLGALGDAVTNIVSTVRILQDAGYNVKDYESYLQEVQR